MFILGRRWQRVRAFVLGRRWQRARVFVSPSENGARDFATIFLQGSLNPQPATTAPCAPSALNPPTWRAAPPQPSTHPSRIYVICRASNRKDLRFSVICRTFEAQHQAKTLQITDSHTFYEQSLVVKPYESGNSSTYADGSG